jgi:AmmeMemoRadiSam system protein A
MELNEIEKGILLKAARKAIQSLFDNTPPPIPDYDLYPLLKTNCGAFVTLSRKGLLRGCIGYISTTLSLYETVEDAARQAATKDPRFLPLTRDELKDLEIEISVLSPLTKIKEYSEIIIGSHGLLLDELTRAVLLPQVAVEHEYDTPAFLSALCEKAGIGSYEWKKRKLRLKIFTSNVFSEAKKKSHERI